MLGQSVNRERRRPCAGVTPTSRVGPPNSLGTAPFSGRPELGSQGAGGLAGSSARSGHRHEAYKLAEIGRQGCYISREGARRTPPLAGSMTERTLERAGVESGPGRLMR
ncbi:hypothetical protein HPB47_021742 [Ixodes persulcatus]|uniref:Uncharacterized protein n=1 Tax=Ixodes persulcatus TaxID=34615 RepID=A0AC60QDU6_IXOPE|nr:hypothetical protein HPB47_021742 [Ixodes persulcatus]